jgi:type VI secretion system secreted protein VgrG
MAITQTDKRLKVHSPLGENALILTSLEASERISSLYELDCTFVSEDEKIDFGDLVGKAIGLELEMAQGETRWFHGHVARFGQSDAEDTNIVYRAKLVPWLWFLTRSHDCRIFQDKSVDVILMEVFDEHKFTDYLFDLEKKPYDSIPYCVQYRESDFDFVSRMMEEWGLGYYWAHEKDKHQLVIFDAPSRIKDCPGQNQASYGAQSDDSNTAGQVADWFVERSLRAGKYMLRDYNYHDPSVDLTCQTNTNAAIGENKRFEIYDYPGDYRALGPGKNRVQLRMEAEEAASHAIRGSGTCYGFCPGYKFALAGHYRDSCNDTYLITEVNHSFSQVVGVTAKAAATSNYQNSFACMPHSVPYRPRQLTPKPVIHGVQTALVVGEGGKEVDIDDLGRIVVQFHWDRDGQKNAASSCRVRVAQAWAGKEWGAYFAPRIGQEVLVEFVEGDPDRPLVTGAVYNGEQKPPFMGGKGDHGGVKSRSTMAGGAANFNEIRFEDTKGKELFFIQAEKDQTITIKNDLCESVGHDESQSVGNDQSIQVTKNRTDSVGVNETRSVGGDRTRTVSGSETVTVTMTRTRNVGINDMINVGAAQEITVGGAQAITVGAAQAISVGLAQTTDVGLTQNVSVGKNRSVSAGNNISEDAGDNYSVKVGKDYSLKAGKTIVVDGTDSITIVTGKAKIEMEKSGDVKISGKDIKIEASGNITMTAKKILQN